MHGGRKRLFEGVHVEKGLSLKQSLYHGRQQIRGKELLMADLALRFGKDMLVVSSPIQEARRAGIESVCDQALALLVEPETIEEATAWKRWPARSVWSPPRPISRRLAWWPLVPRAKAKRWLRRLLRSWRSSSLSTRLWKSPPAVCRWIPTQGVACGKSRPVRPQPGAIFDGLHAFFLNGFTTADDLKCALMGLRKVTDAPSLLRWMCRVTAAWRAAGAPGARPWK